MGLEFRPPTTDEVLEWACPGHGPKLREAIRAVIADEAAKAKPIIREVRSPPFAFEDDEQPEAAGDVPAVKGCISLEEAQESGCCRICGWSTRGPHGPENAVTLNYGKEFAHTRCLNGNSWIAAEISRRVAEAVVAKDKRIAELEEIVADLSDVVKCVSDAKSGLARHRDSLRQQLAAAQAEVSRLTKEHGDIEEKANAWSAVFAKCKSLGMDAATTRAISGEALVLEFITKLREEVSRLTRPVEKASIYITFNGRKRCVEEWEFQRERNARESAEAERDELREAWAMFTVGETANGCHKAYALAKPSDERNNVVLAAYRAERAVGT